MDACLYKSDKRYKIANLHCLKNEEDKISVMVKERFDWIEGSLFLMIASAESTDGYLDEQEIAVILQKADIFVSKQADKGVPYTDQDVQQKFSKALEWYSTIGEEAPPGQIDQKIKEAVQQIALYLKERPWFRAEFAEQLIADLIEIAYADGEVIKNEQNAINMIARLWGVAKPFINNDRY